MNKEIFYNYCPIIQFVDYFSNKWKTAVRKTSHGGRSGPIPLLFFCDLHHFTDRIRYHLTRKKALDPTGIHNGRFSVAVNVRGDFLQIIKFLHIRQMSLDMGRVHHGDFVIQIDVRSGAPAAVIDRGCVNRGIDAVHPKLCVAVIELDDLGIELIRAVIIYPRTPYRTHFFAISCGTVRQTGLSLSLMDLSTG